MSNVFLIGCTHFGHENMYTKFKTADGLPVRPEFKSAEEADEAMIERWNKVVASKDRVYHLGDVAIHRAALKLVDRLNGRICLIKGNHDIFKLKDYARFDDIKAMHKLDNVYLSHVPFHPDSIPHWCDGNIHAHIHLNHVQTTMNEVLTKDTRYLNVSVEWTEYAPISFDEALKKLRAQKEDITYKSQ